MQPIKYDLSDCRVAHNRIYDIELHDGESWVPHGQLAVMRDAVTHDGNHVRTIDYHGPNHALLMWGKVGDPTFQARLNMTECGTAFVGTMSTGGAAPQAVRGLVLEQVYHTQRHLKDDPDGPFRPWENFTIKSEWVGKQPELKITYLLGSDDVSNRVRVTKVDRQKGETTLEMVAELTPPFRQDAFVIVLQSGNRSFAGTLTDDNSNDYIWRGGTAPALAEARAAVFRAAHASRPTDMAPVAATMTLQDLDNISSIQILTDDKGTQHTVDFAQTTCGGYFNKCLVNALDQKWIDGIYGHAYSLPAGVQKVFTDSNQYFKDHAVLGTGQMLMDTLGNNETYKDLMKRIDNPKMKTAWEEMGKRLSVDHFTVWRRVQRYAPEIDKRIRPHPRMSGASYRLDETYVKVGTEWKYLYRAVDSAGRTIEFMLSAKRDVSAAKRFFKKLMRADHRRLPFTIGADKHASYPEAFATSVKEKVLPSDCKLGRVKYLNNVIEQDHRAIRRRWRAMQCFRSFYTAERTLDGVEALHMMRKGQVKRLDERDATGQMKFVESLFGVAA